MTTKMSIVSEIMFSIVSMFTYLKCLYFEDFYYFFSQEFNIYGHFLALYYDDMSTTYISINRFEFKLKGLSPNLKFIMCNPNWIATRRLLASIWIDAFDPKTHFQPKKRILKGTERLSFPSHKNTYIHVTKNNYYTNIFCAISTSTNCIGKNIILLRITANGIV